MSIVFPTFLLLQAVIEPPRAADAVRVAREAVEADSVAVVVARWTQRLIEDSTDAFARLGLGAAAQLTYDYAIAERHYGRLLTRAESADPARRSYSAWAALGMAESRLFRVHFDSASRWFVIADSLGRASGESEVVAQALYGRAIAGTRTGIALTAVAMADTGLRIANQSSGTRAYGRCTRAVALWSSGNVQSGAEAAAGLVLARQGRDRRRESLCLTMIGQHRLTTGQHPQATAYFDTALAVAHAARDRHAAALAVWWRGHHHLERYDHDAAQRDLSAALAETGPSANVFIAGFAWMRLAIISWHFGDLPSARAQLDRGRELVRSIGDAWGLSYARSIDGAIALDSDEIDVAEQAFREELEWGRLLHEPLEEFTALFGLARVAMARRDWTLAEGRFAEAERVIRNRHIVGYLPQLEYEYALVAHRSGNLNEAERRYRRVLAAPGVTVLDRYAARSRLAELHVLRGDPVRAERELVDATEALDSLRVALNDRDLRILAFQARKGYDDTDLGFATTIDGLARSGRVDAALRLAERRRARELRDHLVRNVSSRVAGTAGATTSIMAPSPDVDQRLVDERTAAIEFVTGAGEQPTTAFVLTKGGARAVRLTSADSLVGDIQAFIGLIEAGARAESLATTLGAKVLGEIVGSLPPQVSRLVVVADGVLQRMPFDALRLPDGRYVAERFSISIVPSMHVAAELRARADTSRRPLRVLALGDPRFTNEVPATTGSAAAVYREAFVANGGLPRLPASAAEARLVARFGDRSELRLRERASERYLKATPLDSFAVIHFATHALVDERSVARTALALAYGEGDDGFLGPRELSALTLNARLVVLSGCRTARGVSVRGEGVLGLTTTLLATGARSVLATQWRIDDQAAARFAVDFYRALAGGVDVADAARIAKLAAIRRGEPPSMWAAFAVVGDGFVTVPLRHPTDATRWIGIVGAVGVAITLYGMMRTRRASERRSVPSASRAVTLQ